MLILDKNNKGLEKNINSTFDFDCKCGASVVLTMRDIAKRRLEYNEYKKNKRASGSIISNTSTHSVTCPNCGTRVACIYIGTPNTDDNLMEIYTDDGLNSEVFQPFLKKYKDGEILTSSKGF